MQLTGTGSPATRHDLAQIMLWSALFWLVSYALLSARAYFLYADAFLLIHPVRFLSITSGAALFAAVLWFSPARGTRGGAMRLLWTVLPASLTVLLVRAAYHRVTGSAVTIESDLNFILVWAGYFGLALFTFFSAERARPAVAAASPVAEAAPARFDAHIWLVDALSADPALRSAASRRALAERLRALRGYETCDPIAPEAPRAAARAALIDDLLAGLARRGA